MQYGELDPLYESQAITRGANDASPELTDLIHATRRENPGMDARDISYLLLDGGHIAPLALVEGVLTDREQR